MRRLLLLTLPLILSPLACESGGDDDGGGRNAAILALSGDSTAGQATFTAGSCSTESCHGSDGNSGPSAMPFSSLVSSLSDDDIVNSVLDGKGGMPAQDLEDQEMANVLEWLRTDF